MKKEYLKLYNVSFGILLFMPPGWVVIFFVLVLESFLMSQFLTKERFNKSIMITTVISNIVSGIIGVFLSVTHNGGWWLVWWFPWVSSNEIRFEDINSFVIYFIIAIFLSIVIELGSNMIILHRKYSAKQIAIGTFLANITSNGIVITIMYLISFNF
ncbi:hypothetical protein [Cellulosilyticum sp. I15G10I2]|uniref:hypothetical protein n=1 Tax=Cellulosilyticum sp. I15G10I2 TaxID=1892843 RepID=UPI00085CB241|nr:hypothetical protein [Cellulosilyticum sp. I15G10I2]